MTAELLRYERLASDLEGMIVGGMLHHGDRLPSVRRLAGERRLSVSTVVQALRQLEDRGLVEARPQSGYFVRRAPLARAEPAQRSTPEAAVQVDVTQRLVRVLHLIHDSAKPLHAEMITEARASVPAKRQAGRPSGSKNRAKSTQIDPGDALVTQEVSEVPSWLSGAL